MQKVGAFLIAAILALLFAADPIACPDGCTDDPRAQGNPAASCTFCQRGITLDGAVLTVEPANTVQAAPAAVMPAIPPALVQSIYHPPRST